MTLQFGCEPRLRGDKIKDLDSDEAGNQGAFPFAAVPSVILSQLEVNKSLTLDLSAEARVAWADLRTSSPFNTKGFAASADLGVGQKLLGESGQQQAALRMSWSGDTFGFIAFASHYNCETKQQNCSAS